MRTVISWCFHGLKLFLISLSLAAILFFIKYIMVCRVQKRSELLGEIALAFPMDGVASERRNTLCKNPSDTHK